MYPACILWLVVGSLVVLFAAAFSTWVDRYLSLRRWRASSGRRSLAVEVVTRMPMHIRGEATVTDVSAENLQHRLGVWARSRGYRPKLKAAGSAVAFDRGSLLVSSFAFGLKHVPSTVRIQHVDGEAHATIEYRSAYQYAAAADHEEAQMELSMLLDAIAGRVAG